jgi:ABC-2 type transport system permease protein
MSREDRRKPRVARLLAGYIKLNLAAAMEYRASFLVQVFGMVLNNSAFIVFWLILFDRIGSGIAGYEFTDVMFLWALAAAGYGVSVVTMGNAPMISRIVYNGELDVYLLQPKPVLPNVLFSRMQVSGLGDFAYGVVLFAFTQTLSVSRVALFAAFVILAALVFTAMRVFYHSFTFYFGNAEDFASTASEMSLAFTTYPGSVFTGPTRWLLHSLIPAGLIAFLPAELFREFDAVTFLLLVAADVAIMVIAVAFFQRGLRRYESGNRIGTRV